MMKKFKSLFAILMTFVMIFAALPSMEGKAAETKEVTLTYYWYDLEEGSTYHQEKFIVDADLTFGEFEALYLPIPETDANYNFTGWDGGYDPTAVIADGARLYYDATYDKYPLDIVKVYVDGNNNVIVQKFKGYYEGGTSFANILPEYTQTPSDMGTQYKFTKWNTSIQSAETINMNKTYCEIFADYEDHNIVRLTCDYVQDKGEYGVSVIKDDYVFVDKETALCGKEETLLQAYFEANYAPNDHYVPLGFIDYMIWNGDNWDAEALNDNEWALYVSNYAKPQIILEIEDENKVYVATPGEDFDLPTTINGDNVTWKCDMDGVIYTDTYTIPNSVTAGDVITLSAIIEETPKVEKEIALEYYVDGYGWTYSLETIQVKENASLDEIKEVLPEPEEVEGCEFIGWEYAGKIEGIYDTYVAVYDKDIVNVYANALDKDGTPSYEKIVLFLDKSETFTYGDVLALLEDAEDIDGCTFSKWKISDNTVSEDDIIDNYSVNVEAVYDKYPIFVEQVYLGEDGSVKTEETVSYYDAGTNVEEIFDIHKALMPDVSAWCEDYAEDEIGTLNNDLRLIAQYEDEVIVELGLEYVMDQKTHGKRLMDESYFVMEKDKCQNEDDLIDYFETSIVPQFELKHYNALEFIQLNSWGYVDEYNGVTYASVYATAEYNYDEVATLDLVVDETEIYVYVVEAGEVIKLPTVINGYHYTWYEGGTRQEKEIKDGIYTVHRDTIPGDSYLVEAVRGEKVADLEVPNTGDSTMQLSYVMLFICGIAIYVFASKRREY